MIVCRLRLDFIPQALGRLDRIAKWLDERPHFRLQQQYV